MPSDLAHPPRVWIGPEPLDVLLDAVRRAGGEPVTDAREADAIVWLGEPEPLAARLHPAIRWVQLPSAGVERWLASGLVDGDRVWTAATDAYSDAVAEHVLALALAGRRRLADCARATTWDPGLEGRPLRGATVLIVGAGGIGRALIGLLQPFDADVLAVTRSGTPVDGARLTVTADRVGELWSEAEIVVLAAPATAATRHLVDAAALRAMRSDAWLINVARGSLVDTDALVAALDAGEIAGAALDVTEPEPLPDGHPLWRHPRALVTPHVANPASGIPAALAHRVVDNVARFATGRPLLGVIEADRGY